MKTTENKIKSILIGAAILGAGWFLGSLFSGGKHDQATADTVPAGVSTIWTCSMHPQVQQPKPGKCPICGMDLIPLSQLNKHAERPRLLAMTESSRKLARIETVPVTRRMVEAEISLVGKVDFDETRMRTMAARFPARIDRLYVDYTGIDVRQGDHLAQVYSPELLSAQQELLSAIKFNSNIETARDKLRLWDLSEEKIQAIENRKKPSDRMDIDALLGGIVITKHVNEGDYVKTGEPLFTIADLSNVWVKLDAYESDVPWVRYGQPVTFEAEAVPGKIFEGTVAFISPTLNPKTRTIDIRVNAENPQRFLKPNMFVHATIRPTLAADGKVVAPNLKDKWISPMHPEIVRDKPGNCPICGMPLVKAEELGYSVLDESEEPPLVIPTSAVLQTGKRAVVYVEIPDAAEPTYEGREILIGPRAGGFYIVEEGLLEGERVVSQGNFKIDSALQILAKPSMMSPDGGGGDRQPGGSATSLAGHDISPGYDSPPEFRKMLRGIFEVYLGIQSALARDDIENTHQGGANLLSALDKVDMTLVKGDAHSAWMNHLAAIRGSGSMIEQSKDLDQARQAFFPLSKTVIDLARTFQVEPGNGAVEVRCPMAFNNQGATWLQLGEEIRNPYLGTKMLECGEIVRAIPRSTAHYDVNRPFRERLGALFEDYSRLRKALAADEPDLSRKEAASLRDNLKALDSSALSGGALDAWVAQRAAMMAAANAMSEAEKIDELRSAFAPLSDQLTEAVRTFHPLGQKTIYRVHCPMAFDRKGAWWLQKDKTILNPYFGARMPDCGSIEGELLSHPENSGGAEHEHGK